jgi:hypothetical protein
VPAVEALWAVLSLLFFHGCPSCPFLTVNVTVVCDGCSVLAMCKSSYEKINYKKNYIKKQPTVPKILRKSVDPNLSRMFCSQKLQHGCTIDNDL